VTRGRTDDLLSFAELQALDGEHVVGTYARLPVAFTKGQGSRLYDDVADSDGLAQ